jgi:hypothetical protein
LTPQAPLAWSDELASAARAHSQLMLQFDQQAHQLPGEKSLGDRIKDAGYNWNSAGENAFAYASNVFEGHAGFAIDYGFGPNGLQDPTSHRNNNMSANFTDMGIGIVDSTPGKKTGPLLITQNFGSLQNPGNPYLLGVVYRDANGNSFYDQGEGLGNVNIAIDVPGGPVTMQTSPAGYYQARVPAGTYTVTASGGGLAAPETRMATVGTSNVKADVKIGNVAPALPELQLTDTAFTVVENAGKKTLTVTRTGDTAGTSTVVVRTADGGGMGVPAQAPQDYTAVNTTLTFGPGVIQQTFDIPVIDNQVADGDRELTVTLRDLTGATLGANDSATVTIENDDPPPPRPTVQLESATYTVRENAGKLTLKLTRSPNVLAMSTVDITTVNGTAVAGPGRDYTAVNQTVTFDVNDNDKTIDIFVTDNQIVDGKRTLTVKLSNPDITDLGTPSQATVTIEDDEAAAPQLQWEKTQYTVRENDTKVTLAITRTVNTTGTTTVQVTTADGTAKAGTGKDYTAVATTVSFAANETRKTVDVPVIDNQIVDGERTLTVRLSSPTVGAQLNIPSQTTVTIQNDDLPAHVNKPPVAAADFFVLRPRDPLSTGTSVLANDTDPENNPLTALLGTRPQLGTVTVNANGTFSYSPNAQFWGVDTFTYQASDGPLSSPEAKVTVVSHVALQVRKLYREVLNREPDLGGWRYWTDLITSGVASLGAVASGIFESAERLDPIIAQMYRDYLLREADAMGLQYWRSIWQRDGGPENVIAGIVSSPEFFQSSGGANPSWVTQLYRRLLNRDPEPYGFGYWNTLLSNGVSRFQVVLGFINSVENSRNLVRGWYRQYLKREGTTQEVENYVNQLQNGTSQRAVQIRLIDSPEYFNAPPPPAPGTASRT